MVLHKTNYLGNNIKKVTKRGMIIYGKNKR